MSLFDSYFDPDQFQDSGGLLGRLLSLQGQQGQYQAGAGFDPRGSMEGQALSAPQTSPSMPTTSPTWPSGAPTSSGPQTPDDGPTRNIAIGNYQMPQFGNADVAQAAPPPPPSPNLGDRLNAGLQSWAHTPVGNPFAALANGITGFNAGQRTNAVGVVPAQTPQQGSGQPPDLGDRLSAGFKSWAHTPVGNPIAGIANAVAGLSSGRRADPAGIAQQPQADPSASPPQDVHSQYQALRPLLGDRNAMLATVNPEAGQALVAQALARRQKDGNSDSAESAGADLSVGQPNLGGNSQSSGPSIAAPARKRPGFVASATGKMARANIPVALPRKSKNNFRW
jgi:hypothetical protein